MRALTDDTGILQHAKFSIPNRKEGYTTDDNARALIAILKYYELYNDPSVMDLIRTYLSFLFHMQKTNGRLQNFMDYNLSICNNNFTDSHGRTLWACGYAVKLNIESGIKRLAREVFDKGLKWSFDSSSIRLKAFTIMGLHCYGSAFPDDPNVPPNITVLARQLMAAYNVHCSSDWRWFEPYLTYANPRIPQALFLAYESTGVKDFLTVARGSLNFLTDVQMDEMFVPIGNKGWYRKEGNKPLYDQQPIEAACMIEAISSALRITEDKKYVRLANILFNWFLGKNLKGVALYDPTTGGCFDGITPEGANLNQGAEATISYLLARLEMEKMRRSKVI